MVARSVSVSMKGTDMNTERALRPILRRASPLGVSAGLDLASLARVRVSSEQPLFPIDNVFDEQRGPGGSCWIAEQSGEQMLVLAFKEPTVVSRIVVESEQQGGLKVQTIDLAVSHTTPPQFIELGTRSFSFRPYGPSFQTESWELRPEALTEIRLRIAPDTSTGRACLTSIVAYGPAGTTRG